MWATAAKFIPKNKKIYIIFFSENMKTIVFRYIIQTGLQDVDL